MYKVTKEIEFCYGHRLMNYDGPCSRVHGHNGKVEIEIKGENLDDRSMVRDFSDIKHEVKSWIDNKIDHTMLLREDDPLVEVFREQGEPFYLMEKNPTAESIAELIYNYASEKYSVSKITLWETSTSHATYKP